MYLWLYSGVVQVAPKTMQQHAVSRTRPGTSVLQRFSAEFRLVLACLCFPLDEVRIAAIRESAAQVQTWSRVVAIAKRHRVIGLVERGCARAGVRLPDAEAQTLKTGAATQARQSLLQAMETVRIDKQLRAAGITPLFLKGETLTKLAYGETGLRQAKDIDLLVPEISTTRTMQVLRACGYRMLPPADTLTAEQVDSWTHFGKSMDWRHSGSGVELELHWRLSDLPLLDATGAAHQEVLLGTGSAVATLGGNHLLAYLCLHGATHGWSRLKWLADVFALLPQQDAAACEMLYRRVAGLGVKRPVTQALLLCHDLLGLRLTPAFLHELQSDRLVLLLQQAVLRLLRRGNETEEIYALAFGTSSVYLMQLLLNEEPGTLWLQVKAHLFPVKDVVRWRGPRSLVFVFPVVRAFAWITSRLQHGGRARPSD